MRVFRKIREVIFSFTRAERRGLLVLSVVLVVLIGYRSYLTIRPSQPVDVSEEQRVVRLLDSLYAPPVVEAVRFFFDPNTIREDSLRMLGIPENGIRNLMRYRSKGGRIYGKQDLKKIYGIDDSISQQLSGWIVIERSQPLNDKKKSYYKKSPLPTQTVVHKADEGAVSETPLVVELNRADSAMLVKLPGIGPVYARRIIKYRDLLGGYVAPDQLSEVYGLPPETVGQLKKYLKTDTLLVKPINVNMATGYQLRKHPYISHDMAFAIIRLRSEEGSIKDMITLQQKGVVDQKTARRIKHYLTF